MLCLISFYNFQFLLVVGYLTKMPVTSAQIRKTTIASYGNKVDIPRTSVHRYTNIFIEESRPFYPREVLPIYRVPPLWFIVLIFLFSLTGAASLFASIICLIFDIPFIVVYCQNEWVSHMSWSLPTVKKQKIINDLQTLNALYEVTYAELEMMAISTDDREIGLVRTAVGKYKFQVFHPAAFQIMDKAKSTSRQLLGLFVSSALYNIICIIVRSLIWKKLPTTILKVKL